MVHSSKRAQQAITYCWVTKWSKMDTALAFSTGLNGPINYLGGVKPQVNFDSKCPMKISSGWWFGTFFYFSIQLGIS